MNDLQRFAELSDRAALGEQLSPQELAFLERMAREHPSCRLELELMQQLEDLDPPPNDATRALVDAALAKLSNADQLKPSDARDAQARRRRARSSKLAWTGAALAAAAACALLISTPRTAPRRASSTEPAPATRIELVYVSGDVRIDGKALGSELSNDGRLLREGAVLSVHSGGACIAMDPEIDVCAIAGTELKLTRTSASWRRLDLLSGKVAVQLVKQPEGMRFSIVSDGVWSTAVGTAFTVERDADEGVKTTVLHGKVRVGKDRDREQVVSAHQRARVKHADAEIAAVSRGDESPDWAMLGPTKLWNAPVAATLELSGLPAGAEALMDGQVIGIAPISTLIPVGEHYFAVRIDNRVAWSTQVTLRAGERARFVLSAADLAPVSEPEPAVEPQPSGRSAGNVRAHVSSAASATQMLADARRMLRDGKLVEAAAQYNALLDTHPRSAEGRIGLLSLAELQLEHLHQPSAALHNAERYLAEGGSLAPEAEETRVRALRALGRTQDERAAIEAFLRAHPDSLRASTLRERIQELSKARGPEAE